jgi:predicted NBD/HSP70 family sugar kinase
MRDSARDEVDGAIIGVDVGGSTVAGGLVTPGGDVLASRQRPTNAGGPGTAIEGLLSLIAELQREARARGIGLQGVGVGLPGLVDVGRGMVVNEKHLVPELARAPVADRIRQQTGLPAWIDNDVNALALGEARYGEGRDAQSLVVLAIGTGLGGAMIIDGALVRGRNGFAGEFGHMTVMLNGPACIVGVHGCLCRLLCGEMIARQGRLRAGQRPDSKMRALAGGDPTAVTTHMVFQAAETGDDAAARIVDDACEALGACLGSILNGLNPDVAVVTGGVVKSLRPLQAVILEKTAKYALPEALAAATIRLLPSDKSVTMRGAAALFLYESARRAPSSTRAPAWGQ